VLNVSIELKDQVANKEVKNAGISDIEKYKIELFELILAELVKLNAKS